MCPRGRSLRMPDGSPSLGKPGKDASKARNGQAPSTPGVPQLPFDSPNGKEKRCLLSIFELFEQLSSGAVTPWELTEPSPLDVFVHKLEDGSWGLFCGSHQRLVAFLMHQACNRGEMMQVRCCLRSKEELSYWGWHWNSFYAGSNGLHASPKSPARGTPRSPSASPTRLRSANSMSSPRLVRGFSTPRGIGRGVRAPGPASPGHIQSQAAIAAAAAVMGAEAFQKPAAPRSSPGKASSPQGETKEPLRRSKSAGNAAAFSPRTARRAVPKVQVINVGKS
ncbi:unnamed protein product [Effrenium voratum]|nr:unnamed protein product [Effrenium voratum]